MATVIIIAWYDTFCERKNKQKNFVVSIIWRVIIDLTFIYCTNFIVEKYFGGAGTARNVAITIRLIQEIILEWVLFVRKYKGGFWKRLAIYIPYILGIPIVGFFVLTILNRDLIMVRKSNQYIGIINDVTVLIAMYLMILLIGAIYRFAKHKRRNSQFIFFVIILAIQLVLHYFFEQALLTTVDESKMSVYLTGYIFSAIILLCISAIYQNHLKELEYKRLEVERQRSAKQRAEYYQATSMATTQIMKMEHDFKKHLMIIGQLAKEDEKEALEKYLQGVVSYVGSNIKVVEAGNLTISAILTLMMERCLDNDISFIHILEYEELGIADFDLSTIIGNALENAFEASIKVVDTSKRKIALSIQEDRGIVLIRCKNYYEGEIKYKGKDISSSKEDKDKHGLGLSNIFDAAKRYDGEVSIETKAQTFEIQIVLQELARKQV